MWMEKMKRQYKYTKKSRFESLTLAMGADRDAYVCRKNVNF